MDGVADTAPEPQTVYYVTTRHARVIYFMPGPLILEARKAPVEWRGRWYKVMD
jgi:hypothetical protein